MTPLTMQYTLEPGDVVIDPDGISWYVKGVNADGVLLERCVGATMDPLDIMYGRWRKLDERPSTFR